MPITYSGYVPQNHQCWLRFRSRFLSPNKRKRHRLCPPLPLGLAHLHLVLVPPITTMGFASFKPSSIVPFLTGSKWLPYSEPTSVGTSNDDPKVFVQNNWVLRVLNLCSEDAKAAITAITLCLIF
ncbi:hypothetical protein GQ457_07G002450 [Hibiscus cannabinus]